MIATASTADAPSGESVRVAPKLNHVATVFIVDAVEPYPFDRIYGAWWDRVIEAGAKAKVLRSADRYVDAVTRGRR